MKSELSWTLESGPPEAPSFLEIEVPYTYSGGGSDFFAGGCWNPGDDAEVELDTAWFMNDAGEMCQVNLVESEYERVQKHIYENPPEPDYEDDY